MTPVLQARTVRTPALADIHEPDPSGRPTIALAADPGTARRAVPLLSLLGVDAHVVSWHRDVIDLAERIDLTSGAMAAIAGPGTRPATAPSVPLAELLGLPGAPSAIVATTVGAYVALGDDRLAVPAAVWVSHHDEIDRALDAGATVLLSSRRELRDRGAVFVPSAGIEVDRWPPIPPVVRRRWRERYGLPDRHVVRVRTADAEGDPTSLSTQLAVASVAVVGGPPTLLALALGTPVVTSRDTAKRLGLHIDRDVACARDPERAKVLAQEIAADEAWAASLARRGRRAAEHHLDLGAPARIVQARLGLAAHEPPACAKVEGRLAELATPTGSPIRVRVDDALAALGPPRP